MLWTFNFLAGDLLISAFLIFLFPAETLLKWAPDEENFSFLRSWTKPAGTWWFPPWQTLRRCTFLSHICSGSIMDIFHPKFPKSKGKIFHSRQWGSLLPVTFKYPPTLRRLWKFPLTPLGVPAPGSAHAEFLLLIGIIIFLLVRSPCKISDNPFWDFSNGGMSEKKERQIPKIVAHLSLLRLLHALRSDQFF